MRIGLLVLIAAAVMLFAGGTASGARRPLINHLTWFEAPGHERGEDAMGGYVVQMRGRYSITTHIHAKGLTPANRYTIWWVIFNDPTQCVEGCDFEDVWAAATTGQNPAGIGVQHAGSFVPTATGKFDGSTQILEHATPSCQNAPPFNGLCRAMDNVYVAEAMLFIQDHGPAGDSERPWGTDAFPYRCKTYTRVDTIATVYGESGFDCFTSQIVSLP